jgi:hypothetical protein
VLAHLNLSFSRTRYSNGCRNMWPSTVPAYLSDWSGLQVNPAQLTSLPFLPLDGASFSARSANALVSSRASLALRWEVFASSSARFALAFLRTSANRLCSWGMIRRMQQSGPVPFQKAVAAHHCKLLILAFERWLLSSVTESCDFDSAKSGHSTQRSQMP